MPTPNPQLVALLMCDQAFQQAGTGKWCIIGVFDTLNSPVFPLRVPQFMVYVALSDFAGGMTVELVVRDEDGAVVKAVRGKVPPVPMGLFQHAFPVPEVEFAKPGVHTLELFARGDLISLRSFRVQSTAPDPEREDAEATALAEQHREMLVRDAAQVWARDPEAQPVAMIASPAAVQMPWFRIAFAKVFGAEPPPGAAFVGILDVPRLLRMMSDVHPEVEQHIEPPFGSEGRMLTVAIVTRTGYKFAYYPADRD